MQRTYKQTHFLFQWLLVFGLQAQMRAQHKERKLRPKVSKETGPMLNDDDGQDTDWSSLIDESCFESK